MEKEREGKMNRNHLWFIMEKTFSGCFMQTIVFSENGDMVVKFLDKGGNTHRQLIHADGTFLTLE
jgi:hypothetical protein